MLVSNKKYKEENQQLKDHIKHLDKQLEISQLKFVTDENEKQTNMMLQEIETALKSKKGVIYIRQCLFINNRYL